MWPFKECGFHVGSLCVVILDEISRSVSQDRLLFDLVNTGSGASWFAEEVAIALCSGIL